MSRSQTIRGTIAKGLIAFAVLLPVLIVLAVALHNRMLLTGLHLNHYVPWMAADAGLLGLGLILHRGVDI